MGAFSAFPIAGQTLHNRRSRRELWPGQISPQPRRQWPVRSTCGTKNFAARFALIANHTMNKEKLFIDP
jgi:hypothetical protein